MNRYFFFRHAWWIIIMFAGVVIAATIWSHHILRDSSYWQMSGTAIGGLLGVVYFVQKQALDELKMFHELFTRFNERFGGLNQALADICEKPTDQLPEMKKILSAYFDLCAEEYFFYKLGHIHPKAWKSWLRGMKWYYKNPEIRQHWDKLKPRDYYGFDTALLRESD